jgi:uncharacterized protein
MSQQNVEVVRSIYHAMKTGDFAGLFSSISPSVKIWQTEELPWGGSYEGVDEAKIFFGKVNSSLSSTVALERFIDSGDFIVAIGRTQGATRERETAFDVPLIHLWEVREGKIASLRVFLENATMLAALSGEGL